MKLKKILIGLIVLIVLIAGLWAVFSPKKLVTSEMKVTEVVPTHPPASGPTPTPILIDDKTKLDEEIEKLTPEDFSEDFKNLNNMI